MMMDSRGDMSIADFDRATLKKSEEDLEAEKGRFQAFVAGEYIDERAVIGEDDIVSNYSEDSHCFP